MHLVVDNYILLQVIHNLRFFFRGRIPPFLPFRVFLLCAEEASVLLLDHSLSGCNGHIRRLQAIQARRELGRRSVEELQLRVF